MKQITGINTLSLLLLLRSGGIDGATNEKKLRFGYASELNPTAPAKEENIEIANKNEQFVESDFLVRDPSACQPVLCYNPCYGSQCEENEICITKATEVSPGCPGCQMFDRCQAIKTVSGGMCGTNKCAEGQVCCNSSCGICTDPDSPCIGMKCVP